MGERGERGSGGEGGSTFLPSRSAAGCAEDDEVMTLATC